MSKKKRPWDQSYSGKARRKTPPQTAPRSRRVFVTLELETDERLSDLRQTQNWMGLAWLVMRKGTKVLQVQANVARPDA